MSLYSFATSDNRSPRLYVRDNQKTLTKHCSKSSTLIHEIKEIIHKLKVGNEINVESNSSHIVKLVEKLKTSFAGTNVELKLTRDEIQNILKNFPYMFNIPIRIYFISACEIMKVSNAFPEKKQMKQFMTDMLYLHHNGFVADLWTYLESFIDIIILKFRKDSVNQFKSEICTYLILLDAAAKTGSMIITKLLIVFDSFYLYIRDYTPPGTNVTEEEADVLMMVLSTIIEIVEQKGSVKDMGGLQELKKIFTTVQRLKQITNSRYFMMSIDYCLGLFPL